MRRPRTRRRPMDRTAVIDQTLNKLAAALRERQPTVLAAWRKLVEADTELANAHTLTRAQFNDHIPNLLDTFVGRLQAWPQDPAAIERKRDRDAATHGLQRWQQGYQMHQVTREWGHLHMVLIDELEQFAAGPQVSTDAMVIARRQLAEMLHAGMSESAGRYFQLEQLEAVANVRDLAQLLEQAQQLERQRADLWREAAHDLRGRAGVVISATAGLSADSLAPAMREKFLTLLQRNTNALYVMLNEVLGLTRLQAGQEHLVVGRFDAAAMLRELCEGLQPAADERGLGLQWHGDNELRVEGDHIKVCRIAQNLVLNALKYTQKGGVTVEWHDDDPERWTLVVRDTGPGLGRDADAAATSGDAPREERGEGIGLSIVKRLGELLNATIDLQSNADGTQFRVAFPRRYPAQRSSE